MGILPIWYTAYIFHKIGYLPILSSSYKMARYQLDKIVSVSEKHPPIEQ